MFIGTHCFQCNAQNRNGGEEKISSAKGGVEHIGPRQRLPRTHEGVGERSKDLNSIAEKSLVEINHTKKLLKSGFNQGRRKISDGGGMLEERAEAGTSEAMTQELCLRNPELTFTQANCQALDSAQLQNVSEMLNMRK